MASAHTSDPRDLLAFKCPIFTSKKGFYGAFMEHKVFHQLPHSSWPKHRIVSLGTGKDSLSKPGQGNLLAQHRSILPGWRQIELVLPKHSFFRGNATRETGKQSKETPTFLLRSPYSDVFYTHPSKSTILNLRTPEEQCSWNKLSPPLENWLRILGFHLTRPALCCAG